MGAPDGVGPDGTSSSVGSAASLAPTGLCEEAVAQLSGSGPRGTRRCCLATADQGMSTHCIHAGLCRKRDVVLVARGAGSVADWFVLSVATTSLAILTGATGRGETDMVEESRRSTQRHSATNYRLIGTAPSNSDLPEHLRGQVFSWLKSKRLNYEGFEPGVQDLGPARVTWLDDNGNTGLRTARFQLRENSGWTTTLTAQVSTGQTRKSAQSLIWLDVSGPSPDDFSAVPRLARNVVNSIDVFDGEAQMRDHPIPIHEQDVDELIDILCSFDRRGLVLVAGTSRGDDYSVWSRLVKDVSRQTVGRATTYILDPDATARLQEEWGEGHAVPGGTLRTYRPQVDPAWPADSRRHRILGARRLQQDRPEYLAKMLGYAAQEQQSLAGLPAPFLKMDRRMARIENQLLVPTLAVPPPVSAAQKEVTQQDGINTSIDLTSGTSRPRSSEIPQAWQVVESAVSEMLDTEATAQSVQTLIEFARSGLAQTRNASATTERLEQLQSEVEELTRSLATARTFSEDLQLDLSLSTDETIESRDEARVLRGRLRALKQFDAALSPPHEEGRPAPPDDYSELIDRLATIDSAGLVSPSSCGIGRVIFTGDRQQAEALERHDQLATCAKKAWSAIEALESYAQLKAAGTFEGSFAEYLRDDNHDGYKIPADKYKPVESETVAKRWRREREFPVPESVSSERVAYMEAHVSLGLLRSVSPRMHLLDATGIDGHVYVGYIGRHLTTTQS